MQEIIREEFEQEDASALAPCLCQTLHSQFEPSILPQELDEELVALTGYYYPLVLGDTTIPSKYRDTRFRQYQYHWGDDTFWCCDTAEILSK